MFDFLLTKKNLTDRIGLTLKFFDCRKPAENSQKITHNGTTSSPSCDQRLHFSILHLHSSRYSRSDIFEMEMPVLEFLNRTRAVTIAPLQNQIIMADHTMNVSEMLQLLEKHGILSAPVIDRRTNQILGSVDVMDVVMYILADPEPLQEGSLDVAKSKFRSPVTEILSMCISK